MLTEITCAVITALALPLIEAAGLDLWGIELLGEGRPVLRIYVEGPDGVNIESCARLSRQIGLALDVEDIMPAAYTLEVSSPGLDRVLKTERDFTREQGKMVEVSLYAPMNGEKVLTGKLTGKDESGIRIDDAPAIPMDKIAQVRLHIEF